MDEQLFPTKAHCRFTQYMANKPYKFGIKFWIAVDLESKYVLNAKMKPDQLRKGCLRVWYKVSGAIFGQRKERHN